MKQIMHLFNKTLYNNYVNNNNKKLLKDYLLELKLRGRSLGTIYQYRSDIRNFLCWLCQHHNNQSILKTKKRTFRQFFIKMIRNQESHSRINRFNSSLTNLLEFAKDDDDEYQNYKINVMDSIKNLTKTKTKRIYFLKDEWIDQIIRNLIKHQKYQIALYVSLSYDSAGRRNELLQVKKTNFLKGHATNPVIGKGGKKFRLIYFDRTKQLAKRWLKQRGSDNISSLWLTENGTRKAAKYMTLYSWILKCRKVLQNHLGRYIPFNPHSLRHSALENYNNGSHHFLKVTQKKRMPIQVLKVLAHHSDVAMTESYLKNHDKERLNHAFFG